MRRRRLIAGVLVGVFAVGILTWVFRAVFDYPTPTQTEEEPAGGDG